MRPLAAKLGALVHDGALQGGQLLEVDRHVAQQGGDAALLLPKPALLRVRQVVMARLDALEQGGRFDRGQVLQGGLLRLEGGMHLLDVRPGGL